MLAIIFPPGSFGSTLEYCIRRFSLELDTVQGRVLDNGSMHSFRKEFHPLTVQSAITVDPTTCQIATLFYPLADEFSPKKTIIQLRDKLYKHYPAVLIHLPDTAQAYRNALIFFHKHPPTHFGPTWLTRKRMSGQVETIYQLIKIKDHADPNWLLLTPNEILFDFKQTLLKILDYAGLTPKLDGIDEFYAEWFQKQQYLLDEYATIEHIVNCLIHGMNFSWKPISLMGEAIILQQLRSVGINLNCDNIDIMPTSTVELEKLIVR